MCDTFSGRRIGIHLWTFPAGPLTYGHASQQDLAGSLGRGHRPAHLAYTMPERFQVVVPMVCQ